MIMSYTDLCKKIFTSEGYSHVQKGDYHILGKNLSILEYTENKDCKLSLYENDNVYYISIPYPEAKVWCNAIRFYNPNKQVIYSEFMDKKDGMIINSKKDFYKYRYLFKLYFLLKKRKDLNIVRYDGKIYLTRLVN